MAKVQHFAAGGMVGGGPSGAGPSLMGLDPAAVSAINNFVSQGSVLAPALQSFGKPAESLATAMGLFNSSSGTLAEALKAFPSHVQCEGKFETFVHLTGAEAFEGLKDTLGQMVDAKVSAAISKSFQARMPDAPSPNQSDPTRIS
jgi:hypothetical protein